MGQDEKLTTNKAFFVVSLRSMFLLQFKKWVNTAIINAGVTILFWDGFMPDLTVGLILKC